MPAKPARQIISGNKIMNTYKIELEVNSEAKTSRWSGYTEQVAIAQCFLYEAQNGARELKVLSITEVK